MLDLYSVYCFVYDSEAENQYILHRVYDYICFEDLVKHLQKHLDEYHKVTIHYE